MHNSSTLYKFISAFGLALAICAAVGQPAVAEEPAREFLEALRNEGLFDLAHEYLQQMEKSPLASQEFRETVLYEQGLTLMAISRTETNFEKRQKHLDDAQKKFREFLTAHKNHDYAPKASSELANVLVERARVKMTEVDRAKNESEKPALLKEAGQFYDQALQEFKKSQEEIKKKLESLPKNLDPARDKQRIAFRDELRGDYVKVRMVQAMILHEKSKTAANDKQRNEVLKKAADAYADLYEDYRRRLAGLYALLQQGACYQEMGGKENLNEALTFYQELLEQPHEEKPLRDLRTKTMVQLLEATNHKDIPLKDKALDPAIDKAGKWIAEIRPDENKSEDWLKVYLETGRAFKHRISKYEEKDPKRAVDLKAAKMLVEHGLKHSRGELKDRFLELNAELGGKIEQAAEERPDPQTFSEAYAAGRAAIGAVEDQMKQKQTLEKKVATEKDKTVRETLNQQIADLTQAMKDDRFDAVDFFRRALGFADPTVDLDEVNNVRYYLCKLHYTERNYLDSATYGEFLVRHFPGHRAAPYCAQLARACYLNLYNQADEDNRDFEANRVVGVCQLMIEKWPDDPAADEALITLIKFMVRQKNLAEAKRYLAMVKPNSPRRGEAEIATGQAIWSAYLKGRQQVRQWETEVQQWKDWTAGKKTPPPEVDIDGLKSQIQAQEAKIANRTKELTPLKEEAQQTLKNGIQRMQQEEIDATLATAVLSLCQVYVNGEQPQDAIKLLEDPKIGALTLVQKKDPAVMRQGVPQEAYKTALQAYLGALPGAADKAKLISKAEAAMDGLKNSVPQTPAGQEQLIGLYVNLARGVKEQIENASQINKKPLTQGFASFLKKVAGASTDFKQLNWVAENYYQLGQANRDSSGDVTEDAESYYAKSAEMIDKLLKQVQPDSKEYIGLRLRLASVFRQQGKYVLAMDQMEEVLKDPKRAAKMLNVQMDAAETYMEWSETEVGVPKLYLVAVGGGRRNRAGKPNIWGWKRIGEMLANHIDRNGDSMSDENLQKFSEWMHTAKHQQAECYLRFALAVDDPEKKKDFLAGALNYVRQTARSYPTLGGGKMRKQYDDLVREIQGEMSIEAKGLEAFEEQAEEVASADGAAKDGGGGE